MKRNMVPLLAIAFVVAIISTGVFYGLFAGKLRSSSDIPGHSIVVAARDLDRGTVIQPSDLKVSRVEGALRGGYSKPEDAAGATLLTAVKTNEPLLEERVSVPAGARGDSGSVPVGMRAVTLHVVQSESLVRLLRPGARVDVQAVTEKNGAAELRTILENVEVLTLNSADSNETRPGGALVTVLIKADDADPLALADAGSRVRVALRNPMDDQIQPRRALPLDALFSSEGKLNREELRTRSAVEPIWDHPVQLHVWALQASDAAIGKLRAQISEGTSHDASAGGSWHTASFQPHTDATKLISDLEQSHELETVDKERLTAGIGRPISYRVGDKPDQLRLQFSPQLLPGGTFELRMNPDIGSTGGTAAKTVDYNLRAAGTSSFLVQGPWTNATDAAGEKWASRLFPGRSWDHKHLVIFVSARAIPQPALAAVATADRGR